MGKPVGLRDAGDVVGTPIVGDVVGLNVGLLDVGI